MGRHVLRQNLVDIVEKGKRLWWFHHALSKQRLATFTRQLLQGYDKNTLFLYYYRYSKIIQSTSNNLLVEFKSNADIVRSGFMANYRFIKGN